jgi:hypothetical protein
MPAAEAKALRRTRGVKEVVPDGTIARRYRDSDGDPVANGCLGLRGDRHPRRLLLDGPD